MYGVRSAAFMRVRYSTHGHVEHTTATRAGIFRALYAPSARPARCWGAPAGAAPEGTPRPRGLAGAGNALALAAGGSDCEGCASLLDIEPSTVPASLATWRLIALASACTSPWPLALQCAASAAGFACCTGLTQDGKHPHRQVARSGSRLPGIDAAATAWTAQPSCQASKAHTEAASPPASVLVHCIRQQEAVMPASSKAGMAPLACGCQHTPYANWGLEQLSHRTHCNSCALPCTASASVSSSSSSAAAAALTCLLYTSRRG
mgnify:CR=1 FL=1